MRYVRKRFVGCKTPMVRCPFRSTTEEMRWTATPRPIVLGRCRARGLSAQQGLTSETSWQKRIHEGGRRRSHQIPMSNRASGEQQLINPLALTSKKKEKGVLNNVYTRKEQSTSITPALHRAWLHLFSLVGCSSRLLGLTGVATTLGLISRVHT